MTTLTESCCGFAYPEVGIAQDHALPQSAVEIGKSRLAGGGDAVE